MHTLQCLVIYLKFHSHAQMVNLLLYEHRQRKRVVVQNTDGFEQNVPL